MVTLLLLVIYLCFISLGLPDSLLGAGLPSISASLNVDSSLMSFVAMTIMIFTTLSALFAPKIVQKISTKYVVILSICLTIIGLVGFSFANELYLFFIFAVPYGLGAGMIDAALNNYVASYYSSRAMNFLHCFYGLGAIISPTIMAIAINNTHWNDGFLWTSFIQAGILLLTIISIPLWKVHTNKIEVKEQKENTSFKDTLKIKGVFLIFLAFFCYCSIEGITFLWIPSFFHAIYPTLSEELIASFGSLIFLGLMIGRIIAGIISNKIDEKKLIRYGVILSLIGVVIICLSFLSYIVVAIGFVVIGVGFGPIYPAIIHLTPSLFGKKNSGVIISLEMAFAYIGFTIMPMVFGFIQQYISMWVLPGILFVFLLSCLLLMEISYKKVKNINR